MNRSNIPAPIDRTRNNIQTPPAIVSQMCNLVDNQISDIHKTILEPGCGTGNFLVEALQRRLKHSSSLEKTLIALSTIYGVDIIAKNIDIARVRLRNLLEQMLSQTKNLDYRFWPLVDLFLQHNLIQGDLLDDLSRIEIIEWQYLGGLNFSGQPQTLAQILNSSKIEAK